ncbi:WS/DGAT/MGAT family O-acyltransferase [Amycolatopsis orientalis]|uniref:WS/DGAT/MGAT family O-acyltransferase n=1 Tax=Amycolatopsis orientalis TaxID=31958 RepID=UPI0004018C44|nr:wax ester/triacylglycerol synthase family O-acyltransferase [Amycolatopsis orientalis]
MDHLSPLDAAFLEIEDGDPNASLSIGSVAVLEGPPPPYPDFVRSITARLPLNPRYRQKIHRVPLDLGPPAWVDDDRFDAARHFHRVAVPAPGGENELCDLVALLMAERLDRDHPLWEFWFIEGLPGGRWAVLSKLHHCVADGVIGNELLKVLFTNEPPGIAAAEAVPDPGTVNLLKDAARRLLAAPGEQLRSVVRLALSPARAVRGVADAVSGLTAFASALIPAARSSLSGPIGPDRRYEVAHASLDTVHEICRAFEVTVNDVALAAVTSAFRALLLRRGEKPVPDAMRALVPVSVRGDRDTVDNQVSLMLPLLPVDVPDPVGRLVAVHRRSAALKAGKEPEAGAALTGAAGFAPFAPVAWAVRLAAGIPQHNVVSVVTNVPGPRTPLQVLGREVVDLFPYVPVALRLRTGVAVLSYRDKLTFGITLDFGSAPDPGFLAEAIENDLSALAGIARRSRPADPA